MKVYIASSIELKGEIEELVKFLSDNNITITRNWWDSYIDELDTIGRVSDKEFYEHETINKIWDEDLKAIKEADYVILLSFSHLSLRGALIEVGMALMLDKPVYVLYSIYRSALLSKCTFIESPRELPGVKSNE